MSQELEDFLTYIWGPESPNGKPVFVYVPWKESATQKWHSVMFAWPKQKRAVIQHILKVSAQGNEAYFAPSLFRVANPRKEGVLGSWFLWADLDGNAPENWNDAPTPHPTIVVQTSEVGHQHVYWRINEFMTDAELIEERNRAIAYVLKADTSGWDSDQVLRPIDTMNHKRGGMPVKLLEFEP